MAPDLRFKTIDLDKHSDLCCRFMEETNLCSFGSVEGFHEADGRGGERFIEKIRAKIAANPESCLHVWSNNTIVGQLHLGQFIDPAIGYLNFLYVVPECRGMGVAAAIERYASAYFQQRGFKAARLSVAARNTRALRFYQKQDWKDLGSRSDRPDTHNLEKTFDSAASCFPTLDEMAQTQFRREVP